jgi:hypothetical protein
LEVHRNDHSCSCQHWHGRTRDGYFLAIVIAGIRTCEKHMSMTRRPGTRAEKLASRVLGTHAAIGDEEVLTK